ncbi:LysR family transcriptional regulator [Streptomyces nogalater]
MDLLAHLEAYVATAEEAGFSRAADRLGIAQPLLSRRVKTLEEYFGGPLFDRSRRQIATTELGVLLLPYARDVLDRAQRLRQVARSARRSRVRAVGVPADCAPAALARAPAPNTGSPSASGNCRPWNGRRGLRMVRSGTRWCAPRRNRPRSACRWGWRPHRSQTARSRGARSTWRSCGLAAAGAPDMPPLRPCCC